MNGNDIAPEKPLHAGGKLMLMAGVGAVMLGFYLFSLLAIVLLSLLLAFELLVFLVLARFGAAALLVPTMGRHIGLLVLVVSSFRLRKGVEFRIPLRKEDAPALHELLDGLCQKLAIAFPQEVVLQLGDGAWVMLKGVRSGAGRTTLGIGYDLLAGLSVAEIEAVMAHEMTHAKLIQRGFRNWLMAGQTRLRILANSLWGTINAARRKKSTADAEHILFAVVDWLLRRSSQLIAAYSRQDEFEADRGAAQLCGAAVMKSALSKLESLHRITSRLPWNERVAQLQGTNGYSQWLLQEIAQGHHTPAKDSEPSYHGKYSTHPLMRDRLAALPADDRPPATNSASGIQLLARPDEIAAKLVTEMQRVMAEREKKDSQGLEKFSRRSGQQVHVGPWQAVGVLLVIIGCVVGLTILAGEPAIVILPCSVVAIAGGVATYRLGKYRDRVTLPVPVYEKLVRPFPPRPAKEEVQQTEKAIEAELTQRFASQGNANQARLLAEESYAALAQCDYLRAHVAARLCLKCDKKSVEGALGLAVAAASFAQAPTTRQLLHFVQKRTGFNTFSTAWGAAWAALLLSDWLRAEAMLEKALKYQPEETTLLPLLAIAQYHRGKFQSSIINARHACEADPASLEKAKFLIARWLDGGYAREAQRKLQQFQSDLETDTDLMVSMAQLQLLLHNVAGAAQWTERAKQAKAPAQTFVRLGRIHETARLPDQAANLYQEALSGGHYPEAHLGLGRLEAERNNRAEARKHLLAALNVESPVGKSGANTWQLLQPTLTQLNGLEDPIPGCRAWIAKVPPNALPAAVAGQQFMVYATELSGAQQYLQSMFLAFQPGKPPVILSPNTFRPAPRPIQPEGPVCPGVQGLWH